MHACMDVRAYQCMGNVWVELWVAKLMMIALIAINSGLVPLVEGLCAQIYYFRIEIIGGLRSHVLLCFFGRKICQRKKQLE